MSRHADRPAPAHPLRQEPIDAAARRIRHRAGCRSTPSGSGSAAASALLQQHHAQARVRHHVGQPLARIVRIERQIGAAGLEDAEQPHHHLQRALGQHTDQHIGPDAQALQMMRQAVGVGVERGVAQRAVLEHHRHRVRRACRLRRKQLRQRRAAVMTVAASAAPASPSPGAAPEPAARTPENARCRSSRAGWCRARPRPGSQAGRAHGCASATTAPSSRTSRSPRPRSRRSVKQVGPVVEPQPQLLARPHDQASG